MYCKNAIANIRNLELIPFEFDQSFCKNRIGIICVIDGYDNKRYYSEASPLPPFSQESCRQALVELANIKLAISQQKKVDETQLLASTHFALTSYIEEYPNLGPQLLNGLVSGNFDEILSKSLEYQKRGFTHLKVKIANLTDEQVIVLVKKLSPLFSLRLDANKHYSFDRAEALFSKIKNHFEYIEEPTYEIHRLREITFPIALDETVRLIPNCLKKPPQSLKRVVLKPTMIGGIQRLLPYINDAMAHQIPVLLSSSHESGIGIMQIMNLAKMLKMEKLPIGLDTYCLLKNDTLQKPLLYEGAYLKTQEPILLKHAEVH